MNETENDRCCLPNKDDDGEKALENLKNVWPFRTLTNRGVELIGFFLDF